MFEADLAQEGALALRRRIAWTEQEDEGQYRWVVRFVLDGMAGAVSLDVVFGHHRSSKDSPLGRVHVEGQHQTFSASFAPAGIVVHALRPVPPEYDPEAEVCDVLGGLCFSKTRDWPALGESGMLVQALGQPGGVEGAWDALEGIYREEFVPALGQRALQREAAAAAEARARGAEYVQQRAAPPLVYVTCDELMRAGLAKDTLDGLTFKAGLGGLWVDPAFAQAHALTVSDAPPTMPT